MTGVARLGGLATAALLIAGCGTTLPRGTVRELAVAEDALLVTYAGEIPSCRDHALLHAAEVAAAKGFPYLTVSTPPTMPSTECEVHVRMFRERPESPNVIVYDVEMTQRSLREELAR
jgi:hypothetical protein